MTEKLKMIAEVVPILQAYPFWVQLFVGGWFVLTAILIVVLFLNYNSHTNASTINKTPNQHQVPNQPIEETQMSERKLPLLNNPWSEITGDGNIDQVLATLNKLEVNGKSNPQRLTEIIRRLFSPSVFRHIHEEQPVSATFRFGVCENVLSHYQDFFHEDKIVYEAIGKAITRLIKLQQLISTSFGKDEYWAQRVFKESAFNLTDFERRSSSVLPPDARLNQVQARSANETLSQLRDYLMDAGLW